MSTRSVVSSYSINLQIRLSFCLERNYRKELWVQWQQYLRVLTRFKNQSNIREFGGRNPSLVFFLQDKEKSESSTGRTFTPQIGKFGALPAENFIQSSVCIYIYSSVRETTPSDHHASRLIYDCIENLITSQRHFRIICQMT